MKSRGIGGRGITHQNRHVDEPPRLSDRVPSEAEGEPVDGKELNPWENGRLAIGGVRTRSAADRRLCTHGGGGR